MNGQIFFQKLKVEMNDQKMSMHKLFFAGFMSSFPCSRQMLESLTGF
jgi:hypothetical protein